MTTAVLVRWQGPLVNVAFRRLWLANILSLTGSQVSRIGLILAVVGWTNSVSAVALIVLLETLPSALLSPIAGVAVDRMSKRVAMATADLVRAAALLLVLASPTLAMIGAMVAIASVATCVFQPARAAAVPLVLPPEGIVAANGWDHAAANVMFIVGPAVGTELFLALGLRWVLLIDAATFVASALLIAGVQGCDDAPVVVRGVAAAVEDLRGGWRYLRSHRLVLYLSGLFFASLLCAGLWTPLAPFFIRDVLGGGPRVLGWQFAAFGAGAVAGSVVAPALVRRYGRGAVLWAGLIAEALCQTAYSLAASVAVSIVLILVWGVAVSAIVVPFYALLQTIVDARFRGRVFSTIRQTEHIATMLALGGAVLMQRYVDSRSILLAGGFAYCVFAATTCFSGGGRALRAAR